MPPVLVLAAALAATLVLAGMSLVGGFVAAGLWPGAALTARLRLELYVSSVACLAMTGEVWISAAAR